jgi:hypothetical protein
MPELDGTTTITALDYANDRIYVRDDSATPDILAQMAPHDLLGTSPVQSKSADYTLVISDAGQTILHPAADANARTFTIPANSAVAFPVGTVVTFVNETSQNVTIPITTDTLTLAGTTTTGSRTLGQNGVATAIKVTSTKWIISGSGLT